MSAAAAVRARFAERMLGAGDEEAVRVGEFVLRPAQRRTLFAMLAALDEFGGVLVADPPGSGKTVLALAAIARSHSREALVIAPAALRTQWHGAAERAGLAIRFASVEALSRGTVPPPAGVVVVDEAHHARTPTTRRYARIAAVCRDARVILLSATPVVNRAADRDALLALFLGARAARLTAAQAARCVVCSREAAARPAVRRIGAIGGGVDVPGLAAAIAALPPPLPVAEGSAATALVIMSLALAWRSSLAALDAALRRRLQRGEAMLDLLHDGRAPSRAMLRHWVLHTEATQLAMAALLGPDGAPPAGPASGDDACAVLRRHLEAVRELRAMIRPHRAEDAARRAAAVRALAAAHPARRLVVFARHAESVRALHSALRAEPGVVSIVGARVRGAAGRWSRDEVLRALGPRAAPLRAGDARAIRILLATDVVAEGVELQGIGIVVHADVPWTPARLEQRVGRVTRVGSAQSEVFEARFAAPRGARALLHLGARLLEKHRARRRATREAMARSAIDRLLERFRAEGDAAERLAATALTSAATNATVRTGGGAAPDAVPLDSGRPLVGAVGSTCTGFIAVLDDGVGSQWLVGTRRHRRWRVGSGPHRVLRLLRHAGGDDCGISESEVRVVERLVARATAARAARGLLVAGIDPPGDGTVPVMRRLIDRVRRRLSRLLERAPALARPALAARLAESLRALERPLGIARERQLEALLRSELDDAAFARRFGALLRGGLAARRPSRPGHPGRLDALLILRRASGPRAEPAPRGASPGTAAIR